MPERQGRPFDFADATALAIPTADGIRTPWSLGLMPRRDIVASNLDARRAASDAWSRLQRENVPFRILRDGRLVSAPIAPYDALLVGQAGPDWEIAARLFGRRPALGEAGAR